MAAGGVSPQLSVKNLPMLSAIFPAWRCLARRTQACGKPIERRTISVVGSSNTTTAASVNHTWTPAADKQTSDQSNSSFGDGDNDGGSGSHRRPVCFDDSGDDGTNDANPAKRHQIVLAMLGLVLPLCSLQLVLAPAALAGSKQGLVSHKEEQALPQWEVDAFVDRMWQLSGPIVNNMGFSGLLGACAAVALKFVGRALAVGVGMSLVLIQVLSYYDVITVNWSVVHAQAKAVLDRTGDGRLDQDDFKRLTKKWMIVLSEGVPSVSGFLLGFTLGLRFF